MQETGAPDRQLITWLDNDLNDFDLTAIPWISRIRQAGPGTPQRRINDFSFRT